MTERSHYVAEFQARERGPSPYEDALADALEAAFAQGIDDLPGLVAALDRSGLRLPTGEAWTEAALTAELNRLGAGDAIGGRNA